MTNDIDRGNSMETARCLGIGIVMIIPSFVGGGALWNIFQNWIAVFAWLIIMAFVYGVILLRMRCSAD
jgi:hypothetical protein